MAEIAQRLKADPVLEGSVLQHGDRLRITAQLIEVEPERHLWAQSYDGDPRDFMDLLVRVARAVAEAISVVTVDTRPESLRLATCLIPVSPVGASPPSRSPTRGPSTI
jgi:hypothetical protein